MTTNTKTFTIQVFPHVKKFIKKKVLCQKGVFIIEEHTTVGKMVALALCETRAWKHASNKGDDFTRDRLTASVQLRLTEQQMKMSPRLYKLQRINTDIDQRFKESLIDWIEAQRDLGHPVHAACKSFLAHYEMDETEYSLDSAYKYWQRSNAKKQTVQ